MPTGRRSLTKTCGNGALPLLVTSSVKVTLVLGEPKVGLAVLVTKIFDSCAYTLALELFVTLVPVTGLPFTSTRLVKVWFPTMELSMRALTHNSLCALMAREPISDQ